MRGLGSSRGERPSLQLDRVNFLMKPMEIPWVPGHLESPEFAPSWKIGSWQRPIQREVARVEGWPRPIRRVGGELLLPLRWSSPAGVHLSFDRRESWRHRLLLFQD